MKVGMFAQPIHLPGTPVYEGIQQDLEEIEVVDELGFSEVWLGEHLTAKLEPWPAQDLLIAQALVRTRQIALCSGAYVPMFYHPAALAFRIMQLDHMAQGRYMCGLGAGQTPGDFALVGVDPKTNQNREMAAEALDIMLKIWTEHTTGEWVYEGKYWTVRNLGDDDSGSFGPHMQPFTKPHVPIAMAGVSPKSESLTTAGARNFIPLSIYFNAGLLTTHWKTYAEAAEANGHTPDRAKWRVSREVFVADTDEEAREFVRNGAQYQAWTHLLPFMRKRGWIPQLKHDPAVDDADVDLDYLLDHLWIVGSPDTVRSKVADLYEAVGGFGTLLVTKNDHMGNREAMWRSHELLVKEVVPALPS